MAFNYTTLTWDELVNKIGISRFFNLPKMVEEALKRLKTLISANEPKYKVYTALLSQLGTDAPVATVLENTLGGDIVWSYVSEGTYSATITYEKIPVSFLSNNNVNNIIFCVNELSTVTIVCKPSENFPSGVIDGQLIETPIEIRVYN